MIPAPYIKQCRSSDPALVECIKGSIHHLKPWLRTGIPEIQVSWSKNKSVNLMEILECTALSIEISTFNSIWSGQVSFNQIVTTIRALLKDEYFYRCAIFQFPEWNYLTTFDGTDEKCNDKFLIAQGSKFLF